MGNYKFKFGLVSLEAENIEAAEAEKLLALTISEGAKSIAKFSIESHEQNLKQLKKTYEQCNEMLEDSVMELNRVISISEKNKE